MIEPVLLTFDERVYSLEAIQKAAYRSMNVLVMDISIHDGNICCTIQAVSDIDLNNFNHGLQEFKKEVLDQQLRLKLKTETEAVRNLILGIAFSRTDLQNNE